MLEEDGEVLLDGLGPVADEDDEAVDDPGDAAARGLGVVAREVFLVPHFPIQLGVYEEWQAVGCGGLDAVRSQFFFPDAEERVRFWVVPEDADAGIWGAVFHLWSEDGVLPGMTAKGDTRSSRV